MIIPTYETEAELIAGGNNYIAGCDEVGAGPLAGPVIAAVCILENANYGSRSKDDWYYRVRDSKLISETEREKLAPQIKSHSLAYGIGESTVSEIDSLNILNARLLAMRRAVNNMLSAFSGINEFVMLVDGNLIIPDLPANVVAQKTIVAGDQKVLSIAAASILAKVYRDAIMKDLDVKYPSYNLAKHKGYGTSAHIKAIREFGSTDIHRKSFLKNII